MYTHSHKIFLPDFIFCLLIYHMRLSHHLILWLIGCTKGNHVFKIISSSLFFDRCPLWMNIYILHLFLYLRTHILYTYIFRCVYKSYCLCMYVPLILTSQLILFTQFPIFLNAQQSERRKCQHWLRHTVECGWLKRIFTP